MVGATLLVAVVVIVVPELFDDVSAPDGGASPTGVAGDGFSSRIIPLEEGAEPLPSDDQAAGMVAGVELDVAVPGPGQEVTATQDEDVGGEAGTPAGAASPIPDEAAKQSVALDGALPPDTSGAREARLLIPVPRPKPEPESESEPTLAGAERIGLSAWAIRIGRFSPGGDAIELRDRLRHAGFDAFVQLAYGEEGSIARLYVGPELDRDRAETARRKLRAEQDMDGVVVRFPGG